MSSGEAKIWFQSDQEKVFYLVMGNHQDVVCMWTNWTRFELLVNLAA